MYLYLETERLLVRQYTINDIDDDVNYKYITNFSTKYQASKIEPSVISRTYTQYYEMGGMGREQELSHTITTNIQPYVYIKETSESYIVEYRVPVERTTTMMRSNYYNNSVMNRLRKKSGLRVTLRLL